MKNFLLVANQGLAPIESFTILGLSTARGDAEKIGQFGSGSKHGILTMLRNGIQPRIFIGLDELVFSTHAAKMQDKEYLEVRYTFQGEQHKTGMCLDFGALDWDKPEMALREFICNALDQGENIEECVFTCDVSEGREGETRIYVPTDHQAVQDYWEKIRDLFLHFTGQQHCPIIPARAPVPQFFRRGVFVREVPLVSNQAQPLFTYNFQDGKIDESRNMDGAAMSAVAARLVIRDQDSVEKIMRTFGGTPIWEHGIGPSMWTFVPSENKTIFDAWTVVHGDLPFSDDPEVSKVLTKRGIAHVCIPCGWSGALKNSKVKDGRQSLSDLDTGGGEVVEATDTARETFARAWRWIERARLTSGKPFPEVRCFTMPMDAGRELMGYYAKGVVYINVDYDTSEQTALEELSHYVTGADDETRDFQDFAFKLATRLAKSSRDAVL